MSLEVLDAVGTAQSTIARLRLNAELAGLVKKKLDLPPTGPMAGLQLAKVSADIISVLQRLGVDLKPKKEPAPYAFVLEGGPEQLEQPRVVTEKFFDFDPDRKTSQRRKDNAEAMRILKAVERGELDATALTDDNKVALARYSGTGGNLVGADGKKGSAYEYYTPKPLAAGVWDLFADMGFTGGKVGDPCAGVGIFGATAPANVAMETIELNETSGQINNLVNGGPGYSAVVSPFEAVANRTPDEIWDAVITNVPFGTVHDRGSNRLIDPKYSDQPLEAYFILRSLEKLKPGGLAAFIVPPRVVSGKGGREEQLRIAASYLAEFCGGYRLPNSVFGTADADTITDVIVFRKFGRDALTKIEELKEQNPAALVTARVQWTEFVAGDYFRGEGKRFVLGEFQAKDPNKFRDVDRVISSATVPEISKMLRKFPDSRIDWEALSLVETSPIIYSDGDTMTMAGQTLVMRDGVWVALGKSREDDRYAGMGPIMATPVMAQANKVTWAQARDYVEYLVDRSMSLDMPDWLRSANRDVLKLDDTEQPRYWGALLAGLAAVEVSRHHGSETGFNYLEHYPALSEALQLASATAKRRPAMFSPESKAALVLISVIYDRKAGFSAVWRGDVLEDVMAGQVLTADSKVSAIKYKTQGIHIEVAALKEVYGEEFDPHKDDDWCLSGDGTKATKADDYYTGNLGDFLTRLDGQIAEASGPLRDKLLRQKTMARDRVTAIDPGSLRFNLFSPYTTIEEKAEFLRRFMHPAFVVAHDDDGEKVIICDIGSPKNERERQLKRFAEYLKRGTLSTRTAESEVAAYPKLEEQRRKMLRDMAATAGAQFDQWVKSNPMIMDRMRQAANDPARLYFNEVDDASPLAIDGMSEAITLHGYQNAETRKRARYFGGINGFDVGLGKTLTALACTQYVQSIGVKKKTAFVVPNAVLSNWRAEAAKAYLNLDDCLFVGLDFDELTGDAVVRSSSYARDMNIVLQNRHRKIFFTLEAFKMVPLKDETISAYESYLSGVDPAFTASERAADSERAESKMAEAIHGTGQKSSAIPFFEDMGIDSLVMDEAHMFKNSKNTVDFSGAKFLSVADASQRGLDIQMKAWFVRGLSPLKDGVLALTATPITNSPLEIYSMLCLAVGEEKVHDLTMGAKGADAFMEVMCDVVDDEEVSIDGRIKPYRVFRGLQNVELLRNALSTVATIKTGADVKAAGDDLRLPEAPEHKMAIQLGGQAKAMLQNYKMAYRAARYQTGAAAKDADEPTPEELAALELVLTKFGEPMELVAHPFNLINKMTMVIADPELDERATFYKPIGQAERVEAAIAAFNKLGRVEVRRRPGPWTQNEAILGVKKVKDGDSEVQMVRIKVQARLADDGRIVVDTMDTNTQGDFERLAEKAGLTLDASIPPKLAALLENVRKEEAHPRSTSGRVKQLIFCDLLPLHNKIKRLLIQHAGVPASQIVIVSGQTIKNPEQMQGIQDGFNADDGAEAKYRYVIGNEKIEVGVNLQKGTQALHHLTTGWTPDSTHQRDGRAVRQGNTTGHVNRYHYHADGTFDEYKLNLTTKKGDWIGAVMDQKAGNEVAVAGGLSNDQYDEMIESMGDATAISAIRQRAEAKEREARSETARARQAINLRTAQTQKEFVKTYDSPKEWLVRKGMALFDLRQTQAAMASRVAAKARMSAPGLMKVQTRLAEVDAKIADLVKQIDESVVFTDRVQYSSYSPVREYKRGIIATLDEGTGYSTAAKVREAVERRLRYSTADIAEGSDLLQEWQVEIAAAEKMADESLKDFDRLASGPDQAYPAQIVEAFKNDQVAVIEGRIYAKGMFARDKAGALLVMDGPSNLVRFPYSKATTLSDAIAKDYKFITFGTDEYDAAVSEAAAIDDAAEDVTADNKGTMFSAVVPEVAQRRKTPTLVKYAWTEIMLPAPFFPYPLMANVSGVSENFKALAASQSIVAGWDESSVMIDSREEVTLRRGHALRIQDDARMKALLDLSRASGTLYSLEDFAVVADGWSRGSARSTAQAYLMARAKWSDFRTAFAACSDVPQLQVAAEKLMREAFSEVLALPAEAEFSDWGSWEVRSSYNSRVAAIKRAAELAEMEKTLAEAQAKQEAEAALQPPPVVEAIQAAPVSIASVEKAGFRLSPWVSGKTGEKRVYFNGVPGAQKSDKFYGYENADKALVTVIKAASNESALRADIQRELTAMNGGVPVTTFDRLMELAGVVLPPADIVEADADGIVGLTGETKANMATIKAAAISAGGRAFWMGSKGKSQWNVPAKAWQIIQQNHPDAAQALYCVPA